MTRRNRLQPFTVTSDTWDFLAARRAMLAGELNEIGSVQLPGGVVASTFAPAVRNDGQLEVRLDPREFIKVLRDYADWQVKWWREAVQNAVDAGATKIHLRAEPTDDGLGMVVSCEDNGRGMDLKTLAEKFLVLGGSGKEQSTTTIGGFGEAKKLLILPWLEWHISSHDYHAHGSLAEGTLLAPLYETVSKHRDGVLLKVVMAANYGDYGAATNEAFALECLQLCHLPPHVEVYVNGKRFTNWLTPSQLVSTHKHGEIWVAPGLDRNSIIVRAGGLYMFSTQWVASGLGTITYELTSRTTDVLTSNRDGFRDKHAGWALYELAQKLAVEHKRALKAKQGMFVKAWQGLDTPALDRKYRVEVEAEQLIEALGPVPAVEEPTMAPETAVANLVNALQNMAEGAPGFMNKATADGARYMIETPMRGYADAAAIAKQLVWTPSFIMVNEIAGFQPSADFFPETMAPRVKALMQLWAELCRWVFVQKKSTAEWGVGFIFSNDAKAAFLDVGSHSDQGQADPSSIGKWLLLNPFMFARTTRGEQRTDQLYSKSNRKHLQELYASAVHECTHMADGCDTHDEAFAVAVTNNFAYCADGFVNVVRLAKTIKLEKVEKPPKLPKTQKIRDKGGLTVSVMLLPYYGEKISDGRVSVADPADGKVIARQLLLRMQDVFTPEEIAALKSKNIPEVIAEVPACDVSRLLLEDIAAHLGEGPLEAVRAGDAVNVGMRVDDVADLLGLTLGLSPMDVTVLVEISGDSLVFGSPEGPDQRTIGTWPFFSRLEGDGYASLRLALSPQGFVFDEDVTPSVRALLSEVGLDPEVSIVQQLGGWTVRRTATIDCVSYLMAHIEHGASISHAGVDTVLRPKSRLG